VLLLFFDETDVRWNSLFLPLLLNVNFAVVICQRSFLASIINLPLSVESTSKWHVSLLFGTEMLLTLWNKFKQKECPQAVRRERQQPRGACAASADAPLKGNIIQIFLAVWVGRSRGLDCSGFKSWLSDGRCIISFQITGIRQRCRSHMRS